MRIQTTEFSLTKKDYFKILLTSCLRKYWFGFLIILLISLLGMKLEPLIIFAHIIVFFLFSGIYWALLALWCAARTFFLKNNQLLFQSRKCDLDHSFITEQFSDGSFLKINFAQILKTVLRKNYCLLYYSRNGFIYIPFTAFMNPADQPVLMTLLKAKSS